MRRYILAGVATGVLFGLLDGFINANPLAQRLYSVFKSIARPSINLPAGLAIDLAFGFAMAGIFLFLGKSMPGRPVLKGAAFGALIWFFRVAMQVASQWVMFAIPADALLYTLGSGFVEMLVLGMVYGLILGPLV